MQQGHSGGDSAILPRLEWTLDTGALLHTNKCVRPLELQTCMESGRLWRYVTEALLNGDLVLASEHKKFVSSFLA